MLFYAWLQNFQEGDMNEIVVYQKCWEDMSVPKREELLREAIRQFGKPWKGPTITEMAQTITLENLPIVFLRGVLMPLMIERTVG
jgi:hypothetical protein